MQQKEQESNIPVFDHGGDHDENERNCGGHGVESSDGRYGHDDYLKLKVKTKH